MNTPKIKTLLLAGMISAFLAPASMAAANLKDLQEEEKELQATYKRHDEAWKSAHKGQLDAVANGDSERIKYAQKLIDGLGKSRDKWRRKLEKTQTRIADVQAEKAKKDAEDARQKALQQAEAVRSAEAAKAKANSRSKMEEAAHVAKAKKETEPITSKTPPRPPANVGAAQTAEKKHEQEALQAGKDRFNALEEFAKNPTSANKARYEAALQDLRNKVSKLNEARGKTDELEGGPKRGPREVMSVTNALEQLKTKRGLTAAQIDAMRDAIRDTARSASRDHGRDMAATAARDASRSAITSASKDSAKEANKNMSKTASQSAASSAAKPSGHSYPKPY